MMAPTSPGQPEARAVAGQLVSAGSAIEWLAVEGSPVSVRQARWDRRVGGLAGEPSVELSSCPDNLLTNPGFEGGFTVRRRMNEVVAAGWQPWYRASAGGEEVPSFGPCLRPRDGASAVWQGLWAQEIASGDAAHAGGVYQRIRLPSGSQLAAQVRAYAWASDGDDPNRSEPPSDYALLIGIDPLASEDPTAPHIVWSTPVTQTDGWLPLYVEAAVHGSEATVFLRGQGLRPHKHSLSRWDDACARVLGGIGEPTLAAAAAPTRGSGGAATALTDTARSRAGAIMTREALASALRATVTRRTGNPPTQALVLPVGLPTGPATSMAEEWPSADQDGAGRRDWHHVGSLAGLVFLAAAAFSLGLLATFTVGEGRRWAGGQGDDRGGERDPG